MCTVRLLPHPSLQPTCFLAKRKLPRTFRRRAFPAIATRAPDLAVIINAGLDIDTSEAYARL